MMCAWSCSVGLGSFPLGLGASPSPLPSEQCVRVEACLDSSLNSSKRKKEGGHPKLGLAPGRGAVRRAAASQIRPQSTGTRSGDLRPK